MKAVVMLSKQFFPAHPAAGKPTRFADKVKTGEKRHTCRCNFEYWKAKIARLHEVGGVLCLRQWEGKPYGKGTKQETIMEMGRKGRSKKGRRSNKAFKQPPNLRYYSFFDIQILTWHRNKEGAQATQISTGATYTKATSLKWEP